VSNSHYKCEEYSREYYTFSTTVISIHNKIK